MTKDEFNKEVQAHISRKIRDAENEYTPECLECDAKLPKGSQEDYCPKCKSRLEEELDKKALLQKAARFKKDLPKFKNVIKNYLATNDISDAELNKRVEQDFRHKMKKEYKKAIREELTDKTIKPNDKIKVARVIADMLGVEKAESMSPDQAVNMGLRKIKMKRMTPELIAILRKMLKLAVELGIKVDKTLIPKTVEESISRKVLKGRGIKLANDEDEGLEPAEDEEPNINVGTQMDNPQKGGNIIILPHEYDGSESQAIHSKSGSTLVGDKDDHLRRRKNKYILDDGRILNFAAFISESKDFDLSDDELDEIANSLSPNDLLEVYNSNEFCLIDEETGDETPFDQLEKQALNEILSRMQRMKASTRFKSTKGKRARKLKIALKQHSNPKTLNKRARRLAIKMLKERYLKKPISKMSVAEKERVEKMLSQRKQLVDRLAVRLAPRMRKIETARLSHTKTKGKVISY